MATESSAIFNFFSQLSKDVAINGDVTKLATEYGQIGVPKNLPAGTDANTLINPGCYQINTGGINLPSNGAYFVDVYVREASSTRRFYVQVARSIASKSNQFSRYFIESTDTWSDWVEFITKENLATSSTLGIMQPGDGLEASEDNGIVSVDETVVRTLQTQTISGTKFFQRLNLQTDSFGLEDTVSATTGTYVNCYDKNNQRYAGSAAILLSSGVIRYSLFVKPNILDSTNFKYLNLDVKPDGTAYVTIPTPEATSNTNMAATTEWVRNYTPPSSNKLTTARSIDGINFNGEENVVHYTTCSTAAATVDKAVTLDNFVLTTGAKLYIRFTVTNTAASPTLNVNSTGAKPIQYRNAAISAGYLAANRTYCFIYDGSSYELVGDINIDTNTKVTQTVTTTNNEYPILLSNDANKTATSTTTSRFATNVKVNPSTDTIIAKGFNGDPGVTRWVDSAKSGGSLIENPNADAGAYMPFIRYKSTNGVFVLNGYQNGIRLVYLDDEKINSNTNTITQQLAFSETGELSITGRIKGYLFGTANNIPIGTCSTAAATAAKTVTFQNFVLTTGAHIAVKFTIANTASNPTLNVSETGAKAIRFNNANIPASYLKIGLYEFIYDGNYWNFIGGGGGSDTENGNTTLNNNFNNLINPGRFFVSSTKGTTTNAPMDVTAEWWVDVSVYGSGDNRRILQEARMHTTTTSDATSGPSHILVRCCSNTTWGPWQYSYSQFAG